MLVLKSEESIHSPFQRAFIKHTQKNLRYTYLKFKLEIPPSISLNMFFKND